MNILFHYIVSNVHNVSVRQSIVFRHPLLSHRLHILISSAYLYVPSEMINVFQMTSSICCLFEFNEMIKNNVNDVLMILISNGYIMIIESQTSNYPRMVNIIKIPSIGSTSVIFSYRFPMIL